MVDAGNGMVALYNRYCDRYVKMIWNGAKHTMAVSSHPPDDAEIEKASCKPRLARPKSTNQVDLQAAMFSCF